MEAVMQMLSNDVVGDTAEEVYRSTVQPERN
jgi:hypothetical protein